MSREHWMRMAIEEARVAEEEGEVPVGAVAVFEDQLIARDHNRSIQLSDPAAHAEILILRQAGLRLSNYRLPGVQIYCTIEPCAMCAGALIWARADRLVFGARDEKAGAVFSRVRLLEPGLFNHSLEIVEGVLAEECRRLMQSFFARRR